jgi:acetylxylan esterase
VPDQVKSDALVVAIHSCQSSAQKYFQNSLIPWKKGSDTKGYVTVWPSSTTECWDVSSKASLSHNGGGDSNAIANMITYAIDKYKIDPKKVFVTGGSSGGMMSNVLAATYHCTLVCQLGVSSPLLGQQQRGTTLVLADSPSRLRNTGAT